MGKNVLLLTLVVVFALMGCSLKLMESDKPTMETDNTVVLGGTEFITVNDTAAYSGMEKGETYTVKVVVAAKSDDGSFVAVKDDNGDYVRRNQTFTAKDEKGSLRIDFSFSAKGLKGKELYVLKCLSAGVDTELISVSENGTITLNGNVNIEENEAHNNVQASNRVLMRLISLVLILISFLFAISIMLYRR